MEFEEILLNLCMQECCSFLTIIKLAASVQSQVFPSGSHHNPYLLVDIVRQRLARLYVVVMHPSRMVQCRQWVITKLLFAGIIVAGSGKTYDTYIRVLVCCQVFIYSFMLAIFPCIQHLESKDFIAWIRVSAKGKKVDGLPCGQHVLCALLLLSFI